MSIGARARGDSLLAGRLTVGSETLPLKDLDFGQVGARGALAEELQGFSWLRDLAAAASREKGARLAEAVVGRWLLAHGDEGRRGRGRRVYGASGSSSGPPTRPTSCRAATAVIVRRCSTRWRGAHATLTPMPTAPWRGPTALRPGAGSWPPDCSFRVAYRASHAAKRVSREHCVGAVRRWRADQPLAVRADPSWSTALACFAPAISPPSRPSAEGIEAARPGFARRASRRHDGRWRAVELAGLRSR